MLLPNVVSRLSLLCLHSQAICKHLDSRIIVLVDIYAGLLFTIAHGFNGKEGENTTTQSQGP
jgi:hypothetical protein